MKVSELIKILEDNIPKDKRRDTEIYFLEYEETESETYKEFEIDSIMAGQILPELTFMLRPINHSVS